MRVLGIDPGNTHSAAVLIEGDEILERHYLPNAEFLKLLPRIDPRTRVVCEMIASYGMAVGREVFETCVMIGRIHAACPDMERVTRGAVKLHLCQSARAKDANIRQALLDLWGPPGKKAAPGPTYGITGDMWAALAVATAYRAGCQTYRPDGRAA